MYIHLIFFSLLSWSSTCMMDTERIKEKSRTRPDFIPRGKYLVSCELLFKCNLVAQMIDWRLKRIKLVTFPSKKPSILVSVQEDLSPVLLSLHSISKFLTAAFLILKTNCKHTSGMILETVRSDDRWSPCTAYDQLENEFHCYPCAWILNNEIPFTADHKQYLRFTHFRCAQSLLIKTHAFYKLTACVKSLLQ